MPKRIQSPSSINTYKQCPRKYFYHYIKGLPVKENIHLVRGKIVHAVLEKFFDMDVEKISEINYRKEFVFYVKNLFQACWNKEKAKLAKFGLSQEQILVFYEETLLMLANWLNNFFERLEQVMEKKSFAEAFKQLKPIEREKEYINENLSIRGFVDYIEVDEGSIKLMDYKTSKSSEISEEYRLQLAIYALLYSEQNGKIPHKVGIWFLKDREILLDVDNELLDFAKQEIEQIHLLTKSGHIKDYPKSPSPLCKFSTGQCDFYEECIKEE